MSEQPANWATALDAAVQVAQQRDEYSDAEESQYAVTKFLKGRGQAAAAIAWGRGQLPLQSGFGVFGPERFPKPLKPDTGGNTAVDPKPTGNVPATSASVAAGSDDIERLGMPNIDQAIIDEIQRLTVELINDTKEVLNVGLDYNSIDFVPSEEAFAKNSKTVSKIQFEFNSVADALQQKFNDGYLDNEDADYIKFLDLFSVRYNGDNGNAILTLNIEVPNYNLQEIAIHKASIIKKDGQTSAIQC